MSRGRQTIHPPQPVTHMFPVRWGWRVAGVTVRRHHQRISTSSVISSFALNWIIQLDDRPSIPGTYHGTLFLLPWRYQWNRYMIRVEGEETLKTTQTQVKTFTSFTCFELTLCSSFNLWPFGFSFNFLFNFTKLPAAERRSKKAQIDNAILLHKQLQPLAPTPTASLQVLTCPPGSLAGRLLWLTQGNAKREEKEALLRQREKKFNCFIAECKRAEGNTGIR